MQVTDLKQSLDFSKSNNFCGVNFHCYCLNVFLSFFEGIIGLKTYDILWLRFCRIPNSGDCRSHFRSIFLQISNRNNWRSQFLESHVTLVKLIIFVSWIFPAMDQILLQRFSARVLQFRAYNTRYMRFCQISNWNDCRSVLKPKRGFEKTINICKISFHYYGPNIFSKLL